MSLQRLEQMAVTITGNGPDIIMLHGLGGSAHVFQPLVTELQRDYRIIRPELPGSARSLTPLSLGFEGIADRLLAMMQTLSLGPVHLMGHSLGTLLCQQIAARIPDQVTSLSLFGPLTEPPEAARDGLNQRAKLVRAEGMEAVIDTVVEATTSLKTRTNRPVAVAMVRQLLEAQSAEGYALTCEALASATGVEASQIRCPVTMMTGNDDAVTPPSMMSRLQDQLSDSHSEVVNDCGHWTTLEAPQQCASSARSFLNRLPR